MDWKFVRTRVFRVVLALVLLTALPVFAQFDAASVLGYVRDAAGAAVPNATVTLLNQETGVMQTAVTDGEGKYEFSSVKIGSRYQVTSEAGGFARTQSAVFPLTVNARQRVDVALKAGEVTQTVDVTSAPTQLETETSSRGQVIGTAQNENLPLNGRSYADLSLLVPGVRRSVLEKLYHQQPRSFVQCEWPALRFQQFLTGWRR